MKVGFIGLGNVGGKLAGSLLRNKADLTVRDLDEKAVAKFVAKGAKSAASPKALAEAVDVVITCLPSPAISAAVLEAEDGVIAGLSQGKVWMEMSTTDAGEIKRLAPKVAAKGATTLEAPVSGGCHRADTGNISIFVGGDRAAFEKAMPLLTVMGRRILHTGDLGTASMLKVMTNYLATANLISCCEALAVCKQAGLDLGTTYEAMKISSGTSFVHETESQLILNGSRDIGFTMELVLKDIGLFQQLADQVGLNLELSPLLIDIFKDGKKRYGAHEWSDNIIKRLEEQIGSEITAPGFPAELIDDEPEAPGYEVVVKR